MGLGPLQAIYQARFMKYMNDRGMIDATDRKVWAFMGDGEMDEPESLGAIGMAGREQLDNLIFVVNCNLQRLDGPVRGNGKIIQELESEFRGAGWNVIKVIWGSYWDPLLAQDKHGLLRKRMMECVDGDYQTFKSKDGAYVREHFFNTPELKAMVASWSDDDIWRLNRGGHDPHKVYAAYHAATNHKGQPTVILAKTIKGYGMGESGEAQNITHQQKKMGTVSIKAFRDRFKLPIDDAELKDLPYLRFEDNSAALKYMHEQRQSLGGYLPQRRQRVEPLPVPPLSVFEPLLKASGEGREVSTTMAFVRALGILLRDKALGKRVVPIVPDESRTFGMEGLFRQIGIWNQQGQTYVPQDADQLMFYKESKDGQILQEGINEAGAMADWIAAATAYSTHGVQMIPVYIFYSMFGLQRTGDLAWAAGDSRARGFLVGGTAGRTTLNGEGLQHEDGHSHIFSSTGKVHLADERKRLGKFIVRLAGEACNDIGCDGDIRHHCARGRDQLAERLRRGLARHPPQRGFASALQRQVQVRHEARVIPQGEEVCIQIPRFERGEPQARHIRFAQDGFDQVFQVHVEPA